MDCCKKNSQNQDLNGKKKGIVSGIMYGLMAHIVCIGFIVFSVLGVAMATAFLRPFLMNRYFFHFLVLISFVFATISAMVYLERNNFLSLKGIKTKKKYLFTLYGTTIAINLLLFIVIFPIMTNMSTGSGFVSAVTSSFSKNNNIKTGQTESVLGIKVDIPCSGHASLITGELKKVKGVKETFYRFPNSFDVSYDSGQTSKEDILSLDVFNSYKATVLNTEKRIDN